MVPGELPEYFVLTSFAVDTTVVKFDADARFVPWNTTELMSDGILEQWKTMFPSGTGWGTDQTTFSTTTMTHQLHCLFMMTRIYAGLATNQTSHLPHDYNSHYLHCIDYLRQGVLCAADMATEPHKPTDSDDNGPGDGSWGGLHVCKDYGQVTKYLERRFCNQFSEIFNWGTRPWMGWRWHKREDPQG